jgi:hypothetical protein
MDNRSSNAVAPSSQESESNGALSPVQDTQVDAHQDMPNLGAIRKSGQQEVLKALSQATGVEFNKTKDVVAYFQNFGQNSGGSDNAKGSGGNGELAELRNLVQGLQTQLEQKDRAVRQTSLQSQIKETAIRAGFDPDMLDIATGLFESSIDYDETGNFYIKGANGSVRLDAKGNPYTLNQLAKDILTSRPKLAASEGRSGTGNRFSQGAARNSDDIPDASQDIEAWKQWKERNGIGNRSFRGMTVNVNKPIT